MICAVEVVLLVFVLLSSLTTFFTSIPNLNQVDHDCSGQSIYFVILALAIVALVEIISLATTFQLSVYEEKHLLTNARSSKTKGTSLTSVFSLSCWIVRLAWTITSTSLIEGPACIKSSIYTLDLHYFVIAMWIFWAASALLIIPKWFLFVKSRNIVNNHHKDNDLTKVVLSDDEEELLSRNRE